MLEEMKAIVENMLVSLIFVYLIIYIDVLALGLQQATEEDHRIFFVNTFSGPAREIICYVSLRNLKRTALCTEHKPTTAKYFFTYCHLYRHRDITISIPLMFGSFMTGTRMVGGQWM